MSAEETVESRPAKGSARSPKAPNAKTGGRKRGASSGERLAVRIPGFRLEGVLGRGGMGIVYRARQLSIDRVVAIKILPLRASKHPKFTARFLTEAKAVARLNHENVVQAIDAGRAGEIVYFAMEYIEGESAGERLERAGALPVRDAVRILLGVARALEHAAHHGLVHRDVKPDNVMLAKDGRVLLCDLGLAKPGAEVREGGPTLRSDTAEGTAHYIAPEQARGYQDVDIRADLYALGATAYHLLSGEVPFDGDDMREIMSRQVHDEFPDITRRRKGLPKELVTLIRGLVEKEPEDRPQHPREVVETLARLEGRLRRKSSSGGRRGASARRRRPTPPSAAGEAEAPAAPGAPFALWALAFFALALAGLTAFLLYGREPAKPPAAPVAVAEDPPPAGPPPAPSPKAVAEAAAGEAEAEAALRLRELLAFPNDPDLEQRLAEHAKTWEGTAAAAQASEELARLVQAEGNQIEARLEELMPIVEDRIAKGAFRGAAAVYTPLLTRELGQRGETDVRRAIFAVERRCARAFERVKAEAGGLLEAGRGDQARQQVERFRDQATPATAVEADEYLRAIGGGEADPEEQSGVGAPGLLRVVQQEVLEGRLEEAARAIDAELARAGGGGSERAALQGLRASIAALLDAETALFRALDERSGQPANIALLSGEVLTGRIAELEPARFAMVFEETGLEKAPFLVPLGHLAPAFLGDLLAGHQGGAAIFGLLLAIRRAPEAAGDLLTTAKERAPLGGIFAVANQRIEGDAPEVKAEAGFTRGAHLARTGRGDAAVKALRPLFGELKGTAFATTRREEIAEVYVVARAEGLVAEGAAAFLNGQVEARSGGRVRVSYDFRRGAHLRDFVAATKADGDAFEGSRVQPLDGSISVKGRAVWRGRFEGDVALEAVLAHAEEGRGTVFTVYDQGPWRGWLAGVAMDGPEGAHNLSRRAARPNASFHFPVHAVALGTGSLWKAEFMAFSRGPGLPQGPLKVFVTTRGRRLQLGFGREGLITVPIDPAQSRGGISVYSKDGVVLSGLVLTGVPEPAWLQSEAQRRAREEVAALQK